MIDWAIDEDADTLKMSAVNPALIAVRGLALMLFIFGPSNSLLDERSQIRQGQLFGQLRPAGDIRCNV